MPARTKNTEAPYGYKKDGTARKMPAPDWVSDPARVAAANAKRTQTAAKKRKAAAQAAGSTLSAPAPPANGDLLSEIAGQTASALADADREVAEAQDAIATAEEVFREALRRRDAIAAFHEAIT